MLGKRLGAIVVAIALVVGAVVLRRALRDDSSAGPDPTGGSDRIELVCASELEAACRSFATGRDDLQLTVEPAGATYDRLVADPTAGTVWVTLAPWPQMVSSAVAVIGGEDPFPTTTAVAASDLVLAGRTARMTPLAAHCGGQLTWRCVGEEAGEGWATLGGRESWGGLKPSHADAAQSAAGLLVFSSIVSDYWGTTTYTGTDLQNDDAFLSWLGRLESSIPDYGNDVTTPLQILLAQPRLDVVGTTRAEVTTRAGAQAGDLTLAPPDVTPNPVADVVVAGFDQALGDEALAELGAALADSGWEGQASGEPGGTGLPPADVMIALRDLWKGVARR